MGLTAERLTVRYPDGLDRTQTILDNVELDLDSGLVALVGPSGVGKSTLLRVLAGLQQPDSGLVTVDGKVVMPGRSNPSVLYIPQDLLLVPFLTAAENIELAASVRGKSVDPVGPLRQVGLDDLDQRYPEELSGGQQQRLALARALSLESRVLLPDEPTGSLDAGTSGEVAALLRMLAQTNQCLIIAATHDTSVIEAADRVLRLNSGQLSTTSE